MKKGQDISTTERIRHSLAHLLAMAVLKKFPSAKLGIGPTIENGFYYDFMLPSPLAKEDLPALEKTMRLLIAQNLIFTGEKVTPAKAKKVFSVKKQPFKLELIKEFTKEKKTLTTYYTCPHTEHRKKTADCFLDLCRGGHVTHTTEINADAFRLISVAGAYWRGNEKNPQLTRIYGIAFETKEELDAHLKMLEEAARRDHRKLGPQLELFFFHETAPGMPYWLPKGVVLYNELIRFWRKEHTVRGYQEIVSPLLNKKGLYQTSGHFDYYWENMFVSKTPDKEEYGLKAMNCPNAMIVFGQKLRSYRDLPLRFSDTDTLHRLERSGTLNGLLRVREFRQDDAHCFVTEDQIETEYRNIFSIVERFYSIFNLSYSFRLGTRPEEFMGDEKTWNHAETTLKKTLEESGKQYSIEEGDGTFYGPKIDILMKDAIGREWQMGTIQLDFQQPRRFKLVYIDRDGKEKTPVAIHRVIYGSLERFIGILTEHYAGAFPFWIAPIQVAVLTVNESVAPYAKKVADTLQEKDIRVSLHGENETIGKKIREAEMQKIPHLLIVGNREVESSTVAVRERGKGDTGAMHLEEFIKLLK